MIASRIELILLVTGLITAGALALCMSPARILKSLFGHAPSDPLSLLLARHWGLLVGSVGVLLMYAAYHPEIRVSALIVAIVEKAAFALSIFTSPFRSRPAVFFTALADACMATVYLLYLAGF